jgi:hypothetical protein
MSPSTRSGRCANRLPLLLALALAAPVRAAANGGPLDAGGAHPSGGLSPLETSSVRLAREVLTLRIDDDGTGFQAHARYLLSNPGQPVKVRYGVPFEVELFWDDNTPEEPAAALARARTDAAALATTIRITLAGRETGCELADLRPKGDGSTQFDAVCAAELVVPPGPEVELLLDYRAGLMSRSGWSSKSSMDYQDDHRLTWPVAPAGYWGGPIDAFDAVLEAGRWAGRVRCGGLPAAERSDQGCTWHLANERLKGLPPIEVTVATSRSHDHHQLMVTPRKWSMVDVMKAKASSTLPPQGRYDFAPQRVLDGDPGTAWCEGRKGPGVGEWVEVSAPDVTRLTHNGCQLEGWALAIGYVADQATWLRNGRPRSVRIGPCGGAPGGEVHALEPGRFFDEASALLRGFDPFAELLSTLGSLDYERLPVGERPKLTACARLTILEVARGTDDDLCISEFRPIFNCN